MYRIMVWSIAGEWEQLDADRNYEQMWERYLRYEVRVGYTKHFFKELSHSTMQD
jgi:hypothetical protein